MTYCISDIHGHYDLFCRLMDAVRFGDDDTLYILGDAVDKGPQSVRLAKLLLSINNAVYLAGNHEYDFLKYYRGLMRQTTDYDGVLQKLRAYFPDGALLDWETIDRLEFLPFYAETETFIGVHAGVPMQKDRLLPLARATCEQLVYDRRFKDVGVLPQGGKCVLYGHTPVRYLTGKDEILFYPRGGIPKKSGSIADYCKVHLDMGTSMSGVLGCVRTEDCRCFYVHD